MYVDYFMREINQILHMKSMLTHEGLELATSLSLALMSGIAVAHKNLESGIPHIHENGCNREKAKCLN
jgi:hypothetical protein